MKPVRIIIFAKAPNPGQAKTRLIPALGALGAATLAEQMLVHTITQALSAATGMVELCCTPADDPLWPWLCLPAELVYSDQGEGTLGERMARASQRVIEGGESALLIGTDCPALDAARLRELVAALAKADSVMVPASDGGYVALGMNQFHPLLFQGIAWSTESVAFATLCRLGELGWSVRPFPRERDIDEPADLQWLPESWRLHGPVSLRDPQTSLDPI